jgi:hypothetical protein
MSPLMLALMPVLVILACRTLCTMTPPPVPTYGVIGRPRNGKDGPSNGVKTRPPESQWSTE